MSADAVCKLHCAPVYTVYMLGFSPGFPYLGVLDPRLHTPRRASPRSKVLAGSVAIGGEHTGIYTVDSPGGWNILGHTPVKIFDPSRGERLVDPDTARLARRYAERRFPALLDQPIVETRVCQYETTPDTNFVIDRHPDLDNVWLVGGGSGHGFKHGPVIGRYVVERLNGAAPGADDERFSITARRTSNAGLRTGGDSITADWDGY